MGKTTDQLGEGLHRDSGEIDPLYSTPAGGAFPAGNLTEGSQHPASLYGDDTAGTFATEQDQPMTSTYAADYADTDLATDESGGTDETEAELEARRLEIERTRSEMSQTIDAIQERLSPTHLIQEAKDTVREATVGKAQDMVSNASDAAMGAVSNAGGAAVDAVSNVGDSALGVGSTIIETIKRNPVPAALAGLGLGWLFMSNRNANQSSQRTYPYSRNDSNYGYGYGSSYQSPGYGGYDRGNQSSGGMLQGAQNTASGLANQAGTTASNVAGRVQDSASVAANAASNTASQITGQIQDTAGQVASQVGDTAGHLAHQAQYGVQNAQSGFQQMLRQNPLGVGAAAVAVGMAIGLAIPETPKENEWMGETRDNLMGQAQETVQQTAQKVGTVAQEAVGAAKDSVQESAKSEGLTSSQ